MKKRILSLVLALLTVISLLPFQTLAEQAEACPYCDYTLAEDGTVVHSDYCNAKYAYDGSGDVGKYVRLIPEVAAEGVYVSADPEEDREGIPFYDYEFGENTVMRITGWYWDAGTTALWYRVELYSGTFPESTEDYAWPETPWIMQDYTDETYDWPAVLEFVTVEPPVGDACDICGQSGCTRIHFYCERCQAYDCGLSHLYCGLCEKYDCGVAHIWCGRCGVYDCGQTHEPLYPLVTEPVIPEAPALTEGAEVTVVDGGGANVTGGVRLSWGEKRSLSAWSDLDDADGVSYRWQICYDMANDLWVDIQGQTGKGILISQAIVEGILDLQGAAAVRCVVTAGEESRTSPAIPVGMEGESSSGSSSTGGEDLQKVYVVVQYEYSDGRTAAAPHIAELTPGAKYKDTFDLNTIPGYAPVLENESSFGGRVTLTDGKLTIDYAAGELTEEYTVIKVIYVPAYVSYTVIHYRQNVDNDNYTEHERETVSTTHKTGEVIADAHKSYDGFYNLLYETPAAAADGSTVVEVYYDRYYYLMKFELGENGYGVDPIYARYGDAIEIGTPTRAGYTFLGWKLNGTGETINPADMPKTMPATDETYVAQWQMADSATVNVVIWGENADDEEYSYQKTIEIDAKPGETISWDTLKYDCGHSAHTHSAECGYNCGYEEHEHSAGCYSCGSEEHTHVRACYTASGGTLDTNTSSPSNPRQHSGDANIYYTTSGWNTQYYLKIGNSYYRIKSSGYWWNIDDFNYSINCGKNEHTHGSGCSVSCGMAEHSHGTACYACGKTEHTHSSGCEADLDDGMDTDLWEFYESEEVTVKPDGSTVLNVKFKRKTFTIDFYKDTTISSSNKVYTITDKWGADISEHWPIPGYTDGQRWTPHDSDTYDQVLVFIAIMPQESFYLTVSNSSYDPYDMHYMVEALPGNTGDTYTYNGVTKTFTKAFSISAKYNYVTEAEDFFDLDGFTQWTSDPEFEGGKIENGNSGTDVYFYYTRHRYALEFYNPTELLKKETGIPFEANLGDYDFTPTPADAPEVYEPGSMEFAGWYLNPECTGEQFILADHTMPSAPENGATALVLYAKWEPVEYKVNYFLTKDSLDRGENIPAEMERLVQEAITAGKITQKPANDPYTDVFSEDIVKHGGYIPTPPDPKVSEGYEEIHPRTGYEFLGWFYINEDGDEAAFDPANMPVTQDLNLYAKWSSNKLCKYNVYFALDANGDGVADLGTDGKPIYVADPISGNGLAGHTYTFTAKGGDELYDPEGDVNYREGYFPHTGSHSIVVDIQDEEGTGANSFTFLYQQKPNIDYTVHYLEKGTDKVLHARKTVSSPNVVVTENFVPVPGYMPDEYQKTLILTSGSTNNEIIFWYEKDEVNALYVVNYYIQELNEKLEPVGWTRYGAPLQNTGKIGESYDANAIDIDGFTLSKTYTDQYNVQKKENGATGEGLPSKTISELTGDGKLTGKLTNKGMELNFYYTRNLYPYEFRYMLQGTATQLAPPEYGKAGYDQTVTEAAKEIKMDLDNDGVMEDYRLYDPTETTKSIHIRQDGDPLKADDEVKQGDAKINVATFYYVRCTQTMKVTKTVVDSSDYDAPDPNQEFVIEVLIHSASGYHQTSYAYSKSDGTSGTLSPETARPNVLRFTLKQGETITIDGLPTAEYTVSEQDLPRGYYATYTPQQTNKLTVDAPLGVTVTNTYDPAVLEITKKVDVVEDGNIPEVEDFAFTIKVPDGVTGSYDYTVEGVKHTETVTDGKLTLTLKNGQTARFENVPVGNYTVEEEDYSARGYKSSFVVNGEQKGERHSVVVQVARGETRTVECINKFPVGHLQIEKTVTKEFFGTEWDGDTFTFTVERTTADRPLIDGNKYDVYEGETKVDTAIVEDGKLQVTITFNKTDAAKLDEKSEKGADVIRTIEIRNLPAGTYKVTEGSNAAYRQSPETVSGLEIPAEGTKASFTNELIRPKGDLSLSKELVAADGYTGELPQDTEFSFTFEAMLEKPQDGTYTVEYKDKNGTSTPTTVKMEDGKFTIQIKAGQTVTIKDLPIDTYCITEATVPRMANAFYHNGSETPQPVTKDSEGNLYTKIPVEKGKKSEVKCVNTYPVDHADLIIDHNSAEENQIFVYEVQNTDTKVIITVTVTGNGTTVIHDLPFGEYTVTQKNDWSWRYGDDDVVQTVNHQAADTTVEFAQTWIDYWLGGCSALIKNIFGG